MKCKTVVIHDNNTKPLAYNATTWIVCYHALNRDEKLQTNVNEMFV